MKTNKVHSHLVILVVIAVLVGTAYFLLKQHQAEAKVQLRKMASKTRLIVIGQAYRSYLSINEAEPSSLSKLAEEEMYLTMDILTSPIAPQEVQNGSKGKAIDPGHYIYLPLPKEAIGMAGLVLAYEKPEHFDGKGTLVLFNDGRVEWKDIKEFRGALDITEKWLVDNKAKLETQDPTTKGSD